MARYEEWTRGEILTDNNGMPRYYELHYHQTRLARIRLSFTIIIEVNGCARL